MIFALTADQTGLFLFLSEEDVIQMRKGSTKFVDQRSLGDATFSQVILSLHKSDSATMEMLKKFGHAQTAKIVGEPQPKANEGRCNGDCRGTMPLEQLYEGRCIVCWADEAKKSRIARN